MLRVQTLSSVHRDTKKVVAKGLEKERVGEPQPEARPWPS